MGLAANTSQLQIDAAGPVRPGEGIDVERLREYLRIQLPLTSSRLEIEQFPAGFSNLTYLLRTDDGEMVLRRPPVGANIKTAHDMSREYRILSHLGPYYSKVPHSLLYCADESIIGAPFYVMERVKGVILRAQLRPGLDLPPAVMQQLSRSFVLNLAEIHDIDYRSAGLADLGQPAGYVARQVEGWTKRYFNARTDDIPSIERLAQWLTTNQPADTVVHSLIHNDYKYDNLVLAPDDLATVLAVLDWEMATIGDPLMDLGTTLGYWVDADDSDEWQSFGFGLTKLPGNLTRNEIVGAYSQARNQDVRNAVFYYAYGLLKIAVIVQQIYFRYRKGLTTDPRFANLDQLVRACGTQAERAIGKNRI